VDSPELPTESVAPYWTSEPAPTAEVDARALTAAAQLGGDGRRETAADAASALPQAATTPQLPGAEVTPPAAIPARPRAKRKVIAFPRQPQAAETTYRLADPVLPEQPRILDVPEELEAFPTTPFLEGLRFEAVLIPAGAADSAELPFRAAGIPRRLCAALVDCSLVIAAAALFAFIAHKMLPRLILGRSLWPAVAAVPALLWTTYQYLLVVYAGRTAGMHVSGLRLSTFEERRLSLRQRRHRVLGLYLSVASLAMGLFWALVDVDALCWHDRITGTYPTRRE